MTPDVEISTGTIRLGQFLKLANLIENGSDARQVLGEELVRVNDEIEHRRGRQLVPGDVVDLAGQVARVALADPEAGDDLPW